MLESFRCGESHVPAGLWTLKDTHVAAQLLGETGVFRRRFTEG